MNGTRRIWSCGALLAIVLLGALSLANPSQAATFVVTTIIDTNDGACTPIGCSLRDAVIAANANPGLDQIGVPPGVYRLTIPDVAGDENAAATGDLDLTDSVQILGLDRTTTVISGGGLTRVFDLNASAPIVVDLRDLTIQGGSALLGGNVRNLLNSTATLTNIDVSGALAGGGIYNTGTLQLRNVVIAGNSGAVGGGIWTSGSLDATGVHLDGNTVNGDGGGLAILGGTASLFNATVSGNSALGGSGAGLLVSSGAQIQIANSTISGNQAAQNGGGIFNAGFLVLGNSTVSGNTASGGGGVFTQSSSTLLLNATVTNNAAARGGGIFAADSSVTLQNTIVARNAGPDCSVGGVGAIHSGGYNLDGDSTCKLGGPGDLSGVDPLLGPLADNGGSTKTHALLPLSPALDAGDPFFCPPTDQRGVTRPQGARCDIGAFERVVSALTPTISIGDVSVKEGDTGTTPAVFTVSLSAASSRVVTVDFATADLTATGGVDYIASVGTLTFNPGETTKPITVLVNGDTLNEADETFFVKLSNPTNGTIDKGEGVGTIMNDDPLPRISIPDVSVKEGNAGVRTPAVFIVKLLDLVGQPVASGQTVVVNFATADGTAKSDSDYVANSGTLIFNPGEMTKTLTVTVNGDDIHEPDETFFVNLSNPTNATIDRGQGVGTIVNDDPLPNISIGNGSVIKGDDGGGGVRVAVGDVNGDGKADIISARGQGSTPLIKVFNGADGSLIRSFFAYDQTFTGGVFVAAGDVNGDGVADIITGAGPGGGPQVKVFDGRTGSQLFSFFAYDATFQGGVRVAVGDVNGDGKADIVTAPGTGGGPVVKVFSGADTSVLRSFFAYDSSFTGGVFVAAGDVNGDGVADIITGAGPGGGPHVKVFDGRTGSQLFSFFAYDAVFRGGVRVAAGDVNGDGAADIITGAGPGGGPQVKAFDGRGGSQLSSFFAFSPSFTGGVFVAAGDVNGDGRVDIITGADAGGGPHIKVFTGDGSTLRVVNAYDPASTSTLMFPVMLTNPSSSDVTVDFVTADGTAHAGSDYVANSGTLTIPAGMSEGTISVTVINREIFGFEKTFFGNISNPTNAKIDKTQGVGTIINDDVIPLITGFAPVSGPVGTNVTITGTNFTNVTAVKFNNVTSTFKVSSAASITAVVPQGATTGPISVATAFGSAISLINFTVSPKIDSFTPTSGAAGTSVTINGTNFTGARNVKFSAADAVFSVVSDTSIRAVVPTTATTGKISVTTIDGTATSATNFVVQPKIDSFTPMSGKIGALMTISGAGFSNVTDVKFGSVSTSHFTVTPPTTIKVTVPAGAVTGKITVTTIDGTAVSSTDFTVLDFDAAVAVSRLRLRTGAKAKVQVRGTFRLEAASDGIDPATEPVTLQLSLPGGPGPFWPAPGVMPIHGFVLTANAVGEWEGENAGARTYSLTHAEKTRTGIESFEITRLSPTTFSFNLVDNKTMLAARDYSRVIVRIAVGNDSGATAVVLTQTRPGSGKWTMP